MVLKVIKILLCDINLLFIMFLSLLRKVLRVIKWYIVYKWNYYVLWFYFKYNLNISIFVDKILIVFYDKEGYKLLCCMF